MVNDVERLRRAARAARRRQIAANRHLIRTTSINNVAIATVGRPHGPRGVLGLINCRMMSWD
jgi:hypothetical protein